MKAGESFCVHASTALVGGTGLVYAWMAYAARPADEFAVVNHPLQPQAQHLHILLAPLLVFAVGLIWQRHVWWHWRRGERQRRRSGLAITLTTVPMIASGYLIQTAVEPVWREIWIGVHLVSSGLWLLGYLVHQAVTVRQLWARRQGARSGPSGLRPGELGPAIEDP